jgi:hypothetical protein
LLKTVCTVAFLGIFKVWWVYSRKWSIISPMF